VSLSLGISVFCYCQRDIEDDRTGIKTYLFVNVILYANAVIKACGKTFITIYLAAAWYQVKKEVDASTLKSINDKLSF
jgi:hypothetical protein